jgi:predicted nucleic acid-binding protein
VRAFVPSIWPLEVANALWVGERRKRCTQADTLAWTGFLQSLPIIVDEETARRAWGEVLALARLESLSVYDATYLELALRLELPLATLDSKLSAAAGRIGVSMFAV